MSRRVTACIALALLVALTMCGGIEGSGNGAGTPTSGDAGVESGADVMDASALDTGVKCGQYVCGPGWPDASFWCGPGENCFGLGTQGCPPFACCRLSARGGPDVPSCHQ
jgi:hypothetical protein